MITPSNAWLFLAERSQRSVASVADQLAVCEALLALAQGLPLPLKEVATVREVVTTIRAQDAAQQNLFAMMEAVANGELPPVETQHPEQAVSVPVGKPPGYVDGTAPGNSGRGYAMD